MADEETPPETEASPDASQAEAPSPSEPARGESAAAPEAEDETRVASDRNEAPPTTSQPAEILSPKERKRRAKDTKGPRRPSTPEERQAQRARKRELRRESRRRLREKRRREPAARKAEVAAAAEVESRPRGAGHQKTRQGVVVSDRAAKTITVRIDTAHRHPRYEKIVRTSRTLHAHDERGEAHVGDTVIVRECRPLSRTKRWRLERVVERAG